jgi:type II secretory pathway pseudopilin PulG
MKMRTDRRHSTDGLHNRGAFTLAEFLVSVALFCFVLIGVLYSHLFGMRSYELAKSKLGANGSVRSVISRLTDEIRSAAAVQVGTGDLCAFTVAGTNTLQQGNAIQIYPTEDTNRFVRYYLDPAEQKLRRITDGSIASTVVARGVTNQVVFTAEDFTGQILTNHEDSRVIGLTLQFYQLQYPAVSIGPDSLYDFCQFSAKYTRRSK